MILSKNSEIYGLIMEIW